MPSADPSWKPNNNGTSSSYPLSPHSQPTYLNCYGNVYLLQILIDWKLYSCRALEAHIFFFPWDFPSHCIAPWSQATMPLKYVWSPATARQHEGHGSQQRWHVGKVTSRRHHLSMVDAHPHASLSLSLSQRVHPSPLYLNLPFLKKYRQSSIACVCHRFSICYGSTWTCSLCLTIKL
jgi:hypothetical protein